jgi:hypothetical protein
MVKWFADYPAIAKELEPSFAAIANDNQVTAQELQEFSGQTRMILGRTKDARPLRYDKVLRERIRV